MNGAAFINAYVPCYIKNIKNRMYNLHCTKRATTAPTKRILHVANQAYQMYQANQRTPTEYPLSTYCTCQAFNDLTYQSARTPPTAQCQACIPNVTNMPHQPHCPKHTKRAKGTVPTAPAVPYQTRQAYTYRNNRTNRANMYQPCQNVPTVPTNRTNRTNQPYQPYHPTVPTVPPNRTNRTNQPYQPYHTTVPTVRTRENTCTDRTVPYILEVSLSPLAPILDLANSSTLVAVAFGHRPRCA